MCDINSKYLLRIHFALVSYKSLLRIHFVFISYKRFLLYTSYTAIILVIGTPKSLYFKNFIFVYVYIAILRDEGICQNGRAVRYRLFPVILVCNSYKALHRYCRRCVSLRFDLAIGAFSNVDTTSHSCTSHIGSWRSRDTYVSMLSHWPCLVSWDASLLSIGPESCSDGSAHYDVGKAIPQRADKVLPVCEADVCPPSFE